MTSSRTLQTTENYTNQENETTLQKIKERKGIKTQNHVFHINLLDPPQRIHEMQYSRPLNLIEINRKHHPIISPSNTKSNNTSNLRVSHISNIGNYLPPIYDSHQNNADYNTNDSYTDHGNLNANQTTTGGNLYNDGINKINEPSSVANGSSPRNLNNINQKMNNKIYWTLSTPVNVKKSSEIPTMTARNVNNNEEDLLAAAVLSKVPKIGNYKRNKSPRVSSPPSRRVSETYWNPGQKKNHLDNALLIGNVYIQINQ
ncbi:hypothetical protein TRFO_28862 [Tritrichomonas foetus]|uniref:Uncharacterized protein n=1 Tax=Tritrichomonas foetus TaxID=1144522 RepID=A0A1J4JYW4_9EUKA|nr:hypothetical protein TRFO_28862 [Tritrichomonas foetus]|eukprot:OHT03672.1 hypothetical protein TRFO_28862 [Tritrichomonas foetus]